MAGTDAMRLDQSVSRPEQDRYGFRYVAAQLAQSVHSIGREGSAVIGIEGGWGSGKTSLLNLLRAALDEEDKGDNTFVLSISPWLDGSDTSLVASLLLPVASIIAAEEERRLPPGEQESLEKKKAMTRTARTLMDYTRATARHLAPLAQAATVIPGVPDASGALNALSETVWLKEKQKTAAEMRTEIAEKIVEMDLSFIILLDDLDRLEPAQAVEVVRLVKSVADFPRFRYILCYDKTVLAHAIKKGLDVEDGELYLQKIVQISFGLPKPESFELRREFMSGAVELYEAVNGFPPADGIKQDLNRVTDIYGAALKTPREVHLALNNLRFRYRGLRDYVYLPDLCFLQLLRTSNSSLYDWIEGYLTERAVVESEDGRVSEQEQLDMVSALERCLSLYRTTQARTASSLCHFVPGISAFRPDKIKLFCEVSDEIKIDMTAARRLGSSAYWRYYFAFSSPQNVLPPAYFEQLFLQAGNPQERQAMAKDLLEKISSKGVSSRTWFEHIISQLTWPMIARRPAEQCAGLLEFFFEYGDVVISSYTHRNRFFDTWDLDVSSVVDRLVKRMCDDNRRKAIEVLSRQLTNGKSWRWIAEYFCYLLRKNGLAGNNAAPEEDYLFSTEELRELQNPLAERLNGEKIKAQLQADYHLHPYIWAWRDISGVGEVKKWIQEVTRDDVGFLKILLSLQYKGIRSDTGPYQALSLSMVEEYFGEQEEVLDRLQRIENEGLNNGLTEQIRSLLARDKR